MEDSFFLDKGIENADEESEPPGTPSRLARIPLLSLVHHAPSPTMPAPLTFLKSNHSQLEYAHDSDHPLVNPHAESFRRRFYPGAGESDWHDWRWQLQHRIRELDDLARIIELSEDERSAIAGHQGPLPLAITPYYASLLEAKNPLQSLRRTVVPVNAEYRRTNGEAEDPLGEEKDTPVPGVVHRYPDRALFLVTGFCSTYCRYCTRSRMVGDKNEHCFRQDGLERAIAYLERTPAVRDVLLSGGDPLTLPDAKLEWVLARLAAIPHIEFVRLGTKVPAVLPQRVTPALTQLLRRYHPVWLSVHFTHPDELTPEVALACNRLADAGIPLGSQTVLLAGVNDQVATMKRLMHGLLKMRVRPYYLYQCDPIPGSAHFRTPVAKGLEIIQGLRGHTTGYAVPTYVIDAPGGGGKVPLLPEQVVGRDGDDLLLRNYQGEIYRYPDPGGSVWP